MAVAGVICEYNPFHFGHMRHLERTRELLGEGTDIICVMSGNFVQRGTAAVLEKHARAEMAVRCGANLVVELPVMWAVSSAERFAEGAVSVLAASGVVDVVSFGSECGDLTKLARTAEELMSPACQRRIREELRSGVSYATAREIAARVQLGDDAEVLRQPNDILAVEYMKAIRQICPKIESLAVRRELTRHDGIEADGFAPASVIRGKLIMGEDVSRYVPEPSAEILRREIAGGNAPASMERAENAILARLRSMTEAEYAGLPDGSEGLWRRLRSFRNEPSLQSVLERTKTKRYTMSRLRRMVLAAFLGLHTGDIPEKPPYIRVLAFDSSGQRILSRMRRKATLPVITKPASVRYLSDSAREVFEMEVRAGDLFALLLPSQEARRGGGEWTRGPFRA